MVIMICSWKLNFKLKGDFSGNLEVKTPPSSRGLIGSVPGREGCTCLEVQPKIKKKKKGLYLNN